MVDGTQHRDGLLDYIRGLWTLTDEDEEGVVKIMHKDDDMREVQRIDNNGNVAAHIMTATVCVEDVV